MSRLTILVSPSFSFIKNFTIQGRTEKLKRERDWGGGNIDKDEVFLWNP